MKVFVISIIVLSIIIPVSICWTAAAIGQSPSDYPEKKVITNKQMLHLILQEVKELRLEVNILKDELRSSQIPGKKVDHPMDGHTYDYPDDPNGTNFPPKGPQTLQEATEEMNNWYDDALLGNG